jgi:hypothetical protein
MNGRLERWRKGVRKQKNGPDGALPDDPITPAIPRRMPRPLLFKEQLIYEQLASQSVHGLRENLTCVWSRQPPKIEQLHSDA